jgi:hypothetical protein
MPTTIDSAGITFNDATSLTSAVLAANSVGATQIANGSVTAVKLGTNEQKQICKAWVNFNGTTSPGTIRSSYNVSSVTKNGTGDYTVNFTSALSDANYSVCGTGNIVVGGSSITSGGLISINTATTSTPLQIGSVRLIGSTKDFTSAADNSIVNVQIFGN